MPSPIPPNETNLLLEWLPPIVTLLAAFLGAWFAFLLQNLKDEKKEINTNSQALNKVQINLGQQLNCLTIFNKDFLLPNEESPIRWFAVPAAPYRDYKNLRINAGTLAFLIEPGYGSLITEILVAEEMFQEVMNVINLRSETHVSRLQPKLEEIGFEEGKPYDKPFVEFEKMLGARLVGEMKRFTEGLYDSTKIAIETHENLINKIHKIGGEIFPDKKTLTYQYKNKI